MTGLKTKVRKYLSGKLVLVQIVAGCGAFAGRSLAVYLSLDQPTWGIVMASIFGGGLGYVITYGFGYWLAFRADYRLSGRSMPLDVARLQFVEQLPNIGTVAASALTQGALIAGTSLSPVLAANIGGSFAPHKLLNIAAMLASNTLKKAWVDGSWKPSVLLWSCRRMLTGARRVIGQRLAGDRVPEAT
jgi:hypothetical protein